MAEISFSAYMLVLIFLLYAGINSIRSLRSIFTEEFTECVWKVALILIVFSVCFLVKAGFGIAYFVKGTLDNDNT